MEGRHRSVAVRDPERLLRGPDAIPRLMTLRRADPHTHPLQWSSSRGIVFRRTRHPPEQPRRVQRGDDAHLLNGDEQPCKVRNQSAALNTSVQFVTTFDNEVRLVLRGHPELSSFSQEYTGGRGVNGRRTPF